MMQDSNDPEREPGQRDLGFKVHDRRFWNLPPEEVEQQGQRAEAPTYVVELQQKLADREKQLREYIAAYKQEVGQGLEQTKQRLEREAEQRIKQVRAQLVEPLLELLEGLERALTATRGGGGIEALLQGVELTHRLLVQRMGELGLERIQSLGQRFDPALHEALAVAAVNDDARDGTVVHEFSPGFTLNGRVVRPARVQVGKRSS